MPRFATYCRFVAGSLLVLLAYGCKGVPNPNLGNDGGGSGAPGSGVGNGAANGNQVASYTFLGTWGGVYKNSDTGAELRQTEATASFQAMTTDSGTFRIDLPQLNNVYATGTYQIFNQSSLFLHIAQSTISTIGEPNSTTEISYTLLGSSLELRSDRVSLKLLRSGNTPGAPANNPGAPQQNAAAADPVYGEWHCIDHLTHLWQINLLSNSLFNIQISDTKSERGMIWLQGSFSLTRAPGRPDVALKVQETDTRKYNNMQLNGVILPTGQLKLTRVGPPDEDLLCDRGR